jgi:hypothetical protein
MPGPLTKEAAMMYKTIVLELIHQNPGLYEQLRSSKRLLPAMDTYAVELKSAHEQMTGLLRRENPGIDASLISAQAMELAVHELSAHLSSESSATEAEARSLLDEIMPSLKLVTPAA